MSADTPATQVRRETTHRRDVGTYVAVFVLALVALCAFTIQAWMSYGTGRYVWRMPPELAVALVATFDVFAVQCMILTYLLRGAGVWRAVTSLAFLFALGAQLASAEIYGSFMGWPWEIRWMSALPSVILAIALEMVVIYRLHRRTGPVVEVETEPRPGWLARRRAARALARAIKEQREIEARRPHVTLIEPRVSLATAHAAAAQVEPPPVEVERTSPAEQAAGAAPLRARPPRPELPPAPPPPSRGVPSRSTVSRNVPPRSTGRKAELYAVAVKRVLDGGETAAAVAADLGERPRNVQNWVAEERATRARARTVRDGASPASASG